MTQITASVVFHVAFTPKYRRPVLEGDVAARLKALITEAVAELGARLLVCRVTSDSVRLEVECDPQLGAHRLVKTVKRVTSRQLRDEFPALRSRLPSLWTNAYFVESLGSPDWDALQDFLSAQKGV